MRSSCMVCACDLCATPCVSFELNGTKSCAASCCSSSSGGGAPMRRTRDTGTVFLIETSNATCVATIEARCVVTIEARSSGGGDDIGTTSKQLDAGE